MRAAVVLWLCCMAVTLVAVGCFSMVGSPDELRQAGFHVSVLSRDPLVLQFDDFLNSTEAAYLINEANDRLERSTGGMERTISEHRTSSTAWLSYGECLENPIHNAITSRISDVVQLPVNNQEHFQVLKYDPGQFYNLHHDWVPEHYSAPCGPRVATFFLYLNDVDEGGATRFPQLDIDVQPKLGRAVLWYNSLNSNPIAKEERTSHIATPPASGIKWAANKWIHVNDFISPFLSGDLFAMERGKDFDDSVCEDKNEHCAVWAKAGECTNNPSYMLQNCKKSCKLCTSVEKSGGKDEL